MEKMEKKVENNGSSLNRSAAISVLSLLLLGYLVFGGLNKIVGNAIEKVEAEKVWGMENYKLVKEIYSSEAFKNQQKQGLEAAKTQMWTTTNTTATDTTTTDTTTTGTTATNTTATDTTTTAKTIDTATIDKLKSEALMKWNKDAKIIVFEYSDLQCPYCQRHYQNGTLESLVNKYEGNVAVGFLHFPLNIHPYAQKAAEGLECAREKSDEMAWKYIAGVFGKTLSSEQIMYDVAKEIGLDEAEFKDCVSSSKYASKISSQMSEGASLFGINGTPGNVIVNTENGEYVVVAGAYPASEFEKTIDAWLK